MSLEPDLQCKKTVLKNVKYERREGNNQSNTTIEECTCSWVMMKWWMKFMEDIGGRKIMV